MEKNSFTMLDENGIEILYDVLFTFENDETHKNYIVYTKHLNNEEIEQQKNYQEELDQYVASHSNSTSEDEYDFDADEAYQELVRKAQREIYASTYNPEDPHSALEAIETEKEWQVIETIIETIEEEVQKQNNNEQ